MKGPRSLEELDALLTTGAYTITTISGAVLDGKSISWSILLVFHCGTPTPEYTMQILLPISGSTSGDRLYYRFYSDSWSPWKRIDTTDVGNIST